MAHCHILSLRDLLGKCGVTIGELPDGRISVRIRSGEERCISAFNIYRYGDDIVLDTAEDMLRSWKLA
jgi:hypothetical protein